MSMAASILVAAPQPGQPEVFALRVRALDANGDMTFGRGSGNFLIDSPAAVGQCAQTRLLLKQGEWWLDTTAGLPWDTKVLGYRTSSTRDNAIKTIILGTPGVTAIQSYSSAFDANTREFTVATTIATQYGVTTVTTTV
jgi:hypothetical protein